MTARFQRIAGHVAWGAMLLVATSCSHSVLVKSRPEGATVFMNQVEVGTTPIEIDEEGQRDEFYRIRLEKEGYQSKEYILAPVEKDSFFGCFLFSGGVYHLPDELEFTLYPLAVTRP